MKFDLCINLFRSSEVFNVVFIDFFSQVSYPYFINNEWRILPVV